MVMYLVNIFTHHAIPWENISNDILNTSGEMLQRYIRVFADPSVIVKAYHTAFHGANTKQDVKGSTKGSANP